MSRLLAISDVHADRRPTARALEALAPHPEDWLIVAGDLADRTDDIAWALDRLVERFAQVLWVPGNHELWTRAPDTARGVARYEELVGLCRERGVHTPEDPWLTWQGEGGPAVIALCFLGYDYSFRPDEVALHEVKAWAAEERIVPRDEALLHAEPYPDAGAWCRARVTTTEARLASLDPGLPIVLVNHYCLRPELVRIFKVPRYAPWCGTTLTASWHRRFPIEVAISGHLHMRATEWLDGVRFEEVSLGYPRDWRREAGIAAYLRPVLPFGGVVPPTGSRGPQWWR